MRALLCTCVLLALTACEPEKRSPDAIREQTAKATAEAVRDAKAVTQGVVDGIKSGGTVNVNKASAAKLSSLPGIDDATAEKIIANRPYDEAYDMVKKHVITKAEYNQIAGKVAAR